MSNRYRAKPPAARILESRLSLPYMLSTANAIVEPVCASGECLPGVPRDSSVKDHRSYVEITQLYAYASCMYIHTCSKLPLGTKSRQ